MRTCYFLISILLFTACSKKDGPAPGPQDGQSTLIRDLMGDTAARMSEGGASFKTVYFSFKTNDRIAVSSGEQPSLKWDLAFTGPYNAEVYVNNGDYEHNPGAGGPGKGAVIVVNLPYDQVTEAPADADFDKSFVYKVGWDAGNGTGWFFYSLDNHIAVPVKNRTFVLRTAEGKYAKLEMLNVYKGNPPVVTDLFWPAPYLTFRYYVQQDGSRILKTK